MSKGSYGGLWCPTLYSKLEISAFIDLGTSPAGLVIAGPLLRASRNGLTAPILAGPVFCKVNPFLQKVSNKQKC